MPTSSPKDVYTPYPMSPLHQDRETLYPPVTTSPDMMDKLLTGCTDDQVTRYTKVIEEYNGRGWKVIYFDKRNNRVNVRCPRGHESDKNIGCRKGDTRETDRRFSCEGCKKLQHDDVKRYITSNGWKLLNTYTSLKTKVQVVCKVCGDYKEVIFSTMKKYPRCLKCQDIKPYKNNTSKGEIEVTDYVRSIVEYEVLTNMRLIPNKINPTHPYEMDIWIPEMNKYIDYRSDWHHNQERHRTNDIIKDKWCKENGIEVLVVWDTEWNRVKEREPIKQKIRQFLEVYNG